MAENYNLIFGQGASSQYAWSDSDYQNGWKTVGSTPPTAEQFDALQRRSDTKAKDLNNRLSPLETTASKALAKVTPAANRLPYFNSSNSATTTAISDFSKTLLDDGNAATARATLGAPSTTGGGASGTWGINISGNAKTATTANTATNATHASSADSATTAGNVSNKIYYSSDSPSVATDKLFVVKQVQAGDDNAPNNGLVIQTSSAGGTSWNGKLYITDSGRDGVWIGGVAKGEEVDWTRLVENKGTWDISISGNAASATKATSATTAAACSGNSATATKATSATTAEACSGNSATATKLASESGSNYLEIDTTEDSWSVIGSNPGRWLKSIRTVTSAPPYSIDNFSAAIAFGGYDSKGIITHAYNNPLVKFAGGNGSTARWKFSIQGGSNNEVYDLNNFPTKTGGGASGTWGINISGNAASATTASNVSGKIYYSSDSPSVATDKLFVVKQAQAGDGNVPDNGLVIQTSSGGGTKFNGKLYITDNGANGVWIGGVAKGEEVGWTRLVENKGTWDINITGNAATATKLATARSIALTGNATGSATFDGSGNISISTNVNTATNADKLDGAHLADVYRQVGGHNTPTITSIIDWNTMKACNGGTDVRNINNTTYGVRAYGGDNDFSSGVLNGYAKGSFYLTQDYTNFDKLCFLFCNDSGGKIGYTMVDVFLLNYIMTNYSIVNLLHDDSVRWYVKGYSNKGTEKYKVSTKRIISAPSWDPQSDQNNCGIIDVLGIKY